MRRLLSLALGAMAAVFAVAWTFQFYLDGDPSAAAWAVLSGLTAVFAWLGWAVLSVREHVARTRIAVDGLRGQVDRLCDLLQELHPEVMVRHPSTVSDLARFADIMFNGDTQL